MGYATDEKLRNTASSALSLGATGAGIGTAIAPGIGTAIGGGIGLLVGGVSGFFLTDDEKNEVIEKYRKGQLDDETVAQIEGTIARRYEMLRRSQGADFARRGVGKSSFAARKMADTFNAERESLAAALTGETERRQAIGFGMSDAAAADRAEQVQSGIGALFEGYQTYQQMEGMKADAAADERLAAAIGKLFEGTPATRTPNPTKLSSAWQQPTTWTPGTGAKQTGAGNAFARHRSRAPNVTMKWGELGAARKRTLPSWLTE